MESYMDRSFVVTNHTIIAYCGHHATMKVPDRFGDIALSRIGQGAFMESSGLRHVILPPKTKQIGSLAFGQCSALTSVVVPGGLTEVGSAAFSGCHSLSEITIYELEITASEYHTFKATGNRSSDGLYVLREMPKNELVHQIVSSITTAKPAYKIPDDISSLFLLAELDEQKGAFSLEKEIPVIGFSVPSVPATENKAFLDHVKNGKPETYHGRAEQKNDWYIRVGKVPQKEKTIIFTFKDTETREKNGKYLINAVLKIGYFFWQSAQPVTYEKKQYYIYRRHYLSSNPELEYVRRDIAAYTEQELVNDREEAQNVYAKYKLMSIL